MATANSLKSHGSLNAYDAIAASATDSVLVAAQTGARIVVLGFMINQGDTTASTVTFNSKPSGAGASIWPALKYAANGGTSTPVADQGWFATNVGEGLSVTTGAGSTTGVAVIYKVIPA